LRLPLLFEVATLMLFLHQNSVCITILLYWVTTLALVMLYSKLFAYFIHLKPR
jgi:hypothetical protein